MSSGGFAYILERGGAACSATRTQIGQLTPCSPASSSRARMPAADVMAAIEALEPTDYGGPRDARTATRSRTDGRRGRHRHRGHGACAAPAGREVRRPRLPCRGRAGRLRGAGGPSKRGAAERCRPNDRSCTSAQSLRSLSAAGRSGLVPDGLRAGDALAWSAGVRGSGAECDPNTADGSARPGTRCDRVESQSAETTEHAKNLVGRHHRRRTPALRTYFPTFPVQQRAVVRVYGAVGCVQGCQARRADRAVASRPRASGHGGHRHEPAPDRRRVGCHPASGQSAAQVRPELDGIHPEVLLEAAAPVLKALAAEHGYSRLAVFGSVARHQARKDSDIDLLVETPDGTSSFDFIRFRQLIEHVLGREVDLVSYGGLKAKLDDDIRREAVLL